jgi:hypothetical protein
MPISFSGLRSAAPDSMHSRQKQQRPRGKLGGAIQATLRPSSSTSYGGGIGMATSVAVTFMVVV